MGCRVSFFFFSGVKKLSDGKCPCPVTANIAHVCGKDGNTYINLSAMRCEYVTFSNFLPEK